ncbi:hypothetical protein OC835_004473 [Tilletia horrida]|uniref:Uncharacterized protein n=1 Tax=Tilletia horrida TaxID=155126 RepID=A0AAN6G8R4_9BASI|nr:hypothetical protein OC842_006149 [Tilletia horrida]KAK0528982.1 hypothetical protein OC835_004473 [Tilletia horrida]KAK0560867.1 hypothetical protein OC844_003523 [Tilletia horrida]
MSHGNSTDSSFKKTYQEVGSDHTTSGDLNAQYMNEARQSGPADPASSTSTSERSQLDPSVADPEQEADLRQQGWTNKPSDTNGTRETAGEDEMRARLSG